jgi:hypothetical protein
MSGHGPSDVPDVKSGVKEKLTSTVARSQPPWAQFLYHKCKITWITSYHSFQTIKWRSALLDIYSFTFCSRIFHSNGNVTIVGKVLQNLALCSALSAFEQGWILLRHTCCNTRHRFFRSRPFKLRFSVAAGVAHKRALVAKSHKC